MNANVVLVKRFSTIAALLLAVLVFLPRSSNAQCGFTLSESDSMLFLADAGAMASKGLVITNTSNTEINLALSILGDASFTVNLGQSARVTLKAGDTVTVFIHFNPGLNTAGAFGATLTVANTGTLCDKSLVLFGQVSQAPDKTVIINPQWNTFGTVYPGSDTCQNISIVNNTGVQVSITSIEIAYSTDKGNTWVVKDGSFQFTPALDTSVTIAAGGSYDLNICFYGDTLHSPELGQIRVTAAYNGATQQATATLVGETKPFPNQPKCLVMQHDASFEDAIVLGTTAEHSFTLINSTDHSISVDSVMVDNYPDIFTITSTLPLVVPAHSGNVRLTYDFNAILLDTGNYYYRSAITLLLSGDSLQCNEVGSDMLGYIYDPNGNPSNGLDTTVRPLFPSDSRTLVIGGTKPRMTRQFVFTNNLNVNCTVTSVSLQDGTNFAITEISPTNPPITLGPDGDMSVTVMYTAKDALVHTDSLIIVATHNLKATTFGIQGVQTATADVSGSLPTGVSFSVSPNPATSVVTAALSGVKSATITVTDLLGRTIASVKTNTDWKWDASNAAAGTYIIRAEGQRSDGGQFVVSKEIILDK